MFEKEELNLIKGVLLEIISFEEPYDMGWHSPFTLCYTNDERKSMRKILEKIL